MNPAFLPRCLCLLMLAVLGACSEDLDKAVKAAQKDLKPLHEALTRSAEKHAGKYPDTLGALVETKQLEKVPPFRRSDGAELNYFYISGHSTGDPGNLLLLASPVDTKSGKRCIALINGEVKMVDATEADRLIDESAQSLRKTPIPRAPRPVVAPQPQQK